MSASGRPGDLGLRGRALGLAVLEKIRTEPRRWNQGAWASPRWFLACETAHCFGGWAAVLCGFSLGAYGWVQTKGEVRHVAHVASELLGLPLRRSGLYTFLPDLAQEMFDGYTTLDELQRMVELLPEVPSEGAEGEKGGS